MPVTTLRDQGFYDKFSQAGAGLRNTLGTIVDLYNTYKPGGLEDQRRQQMQIQKAQSEGQLKYLGAQTTNTQQAGARAQQSYDNVDYPQARLPFDQAALSRELMPLATPGGQPATPNQTQNPEDTDPLPQDNSDQVTKPDKQGATSSDDNPAGDGTVTGSSPGFTASKSVSGVQDEGQTGAPATTPAPQPTTMNAPAPMANNQIADAPVPVSAPGAPLATHPAMSLRDMVGASALGGVTAPTPSAPTAATPAPVPPPTSPGSSIMGVTPDMTKPSNLIGWQGLNYGRSHNLPNVETGALALGDAGKNLLLTAPRIGEAIGNWLTAPSNPPTAPAAPGAPSAATPPAPAAPAPAAVPSTPPPAPATAPAPQAGQLPLLGASQSTPTPAPAQQNAPQRVLGWNELSTDAKTKLMAHFGGPNSLVTPEMARQIYETQVMPAVAGIVAQNAPITPENLSSVYPTIPPSSLINSNGTMDLIKAGDEKAKMFGGFMSGGGGQGAGGPGGPNVGDSLGRYVPNPQTGAMEYKEYPTGLLKMPSGLQARVQDALLAQHKDFMDNDTTKQYVVVQGALQGMQEAFKTAQENPNDPNNTTLDNALLTDFAKIGNPGGVVREGTIELEREAAGWKGDLQRSYEKVSGGGILDTRTRANLLRIAQAQVKGKTDLFNRFRNDELGTAYDTVGDPRYKGFVDQMFLPSIGTPQQEDNSAPASNPSVPDIGTDAASAAAAYAKLPPGARFTSGGKPFIKPK